MSRKSRQAKLRRAQHHSAPKRDIHHKSSQDRVYRCLHGWVETDVPQIEEGYAWTVAESSIEDLLPDLERSIGTRKYVEHLEQLSDHLVRRSFDYGLPQGVTDCDAWIAREVETYLAETFAEFASWTR